MFQVRIATLSAPLSSLETEVAMLQRIRNIKPLWPQRSQVPRPSRQVPRCSRGPYVAQNAVSSMTGFVQMASSRCSNTPVPTSRRRCGRGLLRRQGRPPGVIRCRGGAGVSTRPKDGGSDPHRRDPGGHGLRGRPHTTPSTNANTSAKGMARSRPNRRCRPSRARPTAGDDSPHRKRAS